MPPATRTKRGRTSGTSVSLTLQDSATPAPMEPGVQQSSGTSVSSLILPVGAPMPPREESLKNLCECERHRCRIRKDSLIFPRVEALVHLQAE
jgi:hypothetical protein